MIIKQLVIKNRIETQTNTHLAVATHLNRLHPARLFDLVVDDRPVLADCFIPSSKTDGVLGRAERQKS